VQQLSEGPRRRSDPRLRIAVPARLLLIGMVALAAGNRLEAQLSAPDLEEASEFARRAAGAAVRGPDRVFSEALDADAILSSQVGADAWSGLSERQRQQLRTIVRDRFLTALRAPHGTPGEIVWSAARPGPDSVDVFLGIGLREKTLKTQWRIRGSTSGWRVRDVILVDPGISLARAASKSLGSEPVHRRHRAQQVRAEAAPRAAGLVVIALVAALAAHRLERPRRHLLFMMAAVPALLFVTDGVLAVRRVLGERYAIQEGLPREPWASAEETGRTEERRGRVAEARAAWAKALSAGADPGPIEYEIGLAAKGRGDLSRAEVFFRKALEESVSAPGAARELASIAAAAGRLPEAERYLERYFSLSGPDPDSLSLAAVVKTGLGKSAEALEAIRQARLLVGEGWRATELEARVRARAGDATGTVAALRMLERDHGIDRSALRANPEFLPIATDPIWTTFLNEPPRPAPTAPPSPGR
jgi:tetratricopeptide (TPR) repeat protein